MSFLYLLFVYVLLKTDSFVYYTVASAGQHKLIVKDSLGKEKQHDKSVNITGFERVVSYPEPKKICGAQIDQLRRLHGPKMGRVGFIFSARKTKFESWVVRAEQTNFILSTCLGVFSRVIPCSTLCSRSQPIGISDRVLTLFIIHTKFSCLCTSKMGSKTRIKNFPGLKLSKDTRIFNFLDPIDGWIPGRFKRKATKMPELFDGSIASFLYMKRRLELETKRPSALVQFHHSNFFKRRNPVRSNVKFMGYFGLKRPEFWHEIQAWGQKNNVYVYDSHPPLRTNAQNVLWSDRALSAISLGDEYANMMTNMDVGIVWNQCGKRRGCKLSKPSQRLNNHWSTGLPTVVYKGYASMDEALAKATYTAVATNKDEVIAQLDKLLSNKTYRSVLSTAGRNFAFLNSDPIYVGLVWIEELCCIMRQHHCCEEHKSVKGS